GNCRHGLFQIGGLEVLHHRRRAVGVRSNHQSGKSCRIYVVIHCLLCLLQERIQGLVREEFSKPFRELDLAISVRHRRILRYTFNALYLLGISLWCYRFTHSGLCRLRVRIVLETERLAGRSILRTYRHPLCRPLCAPTALWPHALDFRLASGRRPYRLPLGPDRPALLLSSWG